MAIEIVDLPINRMFFLTIVTYVSLPEGTSEFIMNQSLYLTCGETPKSPAPLVVKVPVLVFRCWTPTWASPPTGPMR